MRLSTMESPNDETDRRVTVEAEYTPAECSEATTHRWTFHDRPPGEAKEIVLTRYIPVEATLWRMGLWYGGPEDRPDTGHEDGILDIEEDT